jgi:hypothetical protein
MPEENNSETPAKRKRAVKRPAAKKRAVRKPAAEASTAATPAAVPAATSASAPVTGDRLAEVARTIGSTVGGIVAKTKKALRRDGEIP